MKKFLDACRRLLSIALNLFVLCAEPIALPLSWEMGQAQIFTYYTEDSNIFAAAVCTLVAVCQLWCIFTGGELPRWLKRLKFMATSQHSRMDTSTTTVMLSSVPFQHSAVPKK